MSGKISTKFGEMNGSDIDCNDKSGETPLALVVLHCFVAYSSHLWLAEKLCLNMSLLSHWLPSQKSFAAATD